MDVLNKFLQAEINSKEYYESIINFINLYEIRKGEFEGNEYVIMKMDRDNFIIFSEYDDGEGGIQIPLRRCTKGYYIKQLKMDCQPTEFTALSRHRAVFHGQKKEVSLLAGLD